MLNTIKEITENNDYFTLYLNMYSIFKVLFSFKGLLNYIYVR